MPRTIPWILSASVQTQSLMRVHNRLSPIDGIPDEYANERGCLSFAGAGRQHTSSRAETSERSLPKRSAPIGRRITEAVQDGSQSERGKDRKRYDALMQYRPGGTRRLLFCLHYGLKASKNKYAVCPGSW
jgi:hypothetical protein